MPFEIEKKLIIFDYLYSAWDAMNVIDTDESNYAQTQIDKAIILTTKELITLYRREKENRHVNKLEEA